MCHSKNEDRAEQEIQKNDNWDIQIDMNIYQKVFDDRIEHKKQKIVDVARLKQADIESGLSKCVKHSVGCIITDSAGRIVSTGRNGTKSGSTNCSEQFPTYKDDMSNLSLSIGNLHVGTKKQADAIVKTYELNKAHHEWSEINEIHAECNAIMHSSPEQRKGGTLYVNLQPCSSCAKMIAGCGVSRVVYGKSYHRTDEHITRELFKKANVQYINIPNILK